MTASTRRRRERVPRSDGSVAVQTKPPRADILTYANGWPTVLVRRTHDVETARELAAARWAETGDERPLAHHRVGWWRTTMTSRRPDGAATDEQGRVVQWCEDAEHAAGPGVEFRP
ncbi:hypothetical protein GCM10009613_60990 [Pseudonocardia kongjuensis]|uniref:Uncharacterized protein n=1 Tax=Pseudonocardia kongjuensis TaxID=102227 RepID=A0ABP4J239_9PSEU